MQINDIEHGVMCLLAKSLHDSVALGFVNLLPLDRESGANVVFPTESYRTCKFKRWITSALNIKNCSAKLLLSVTIIVCSKNFSFVVCFAVTLDYKALLLLLQKWDDQEFVLGGKGYDNEFCAFCDAIRVSKFLSQL